MTAAWPFLVARGRVRDYRTVLLPGLLSGPGAAAALADALPVGEPGAAQRTATVDGRWLGAHRVTSRTALLRPDDVGAERDGEPFVADEHGRPLVYLFGLLSPATAAGQPGDADMAAAQDAALRAYREFLADEHAFTCSSSAPIEVPPAPPEPARPVPTREYRQVASVGPARAPRPVGGRVRIGTLAVAVGALVVVLFLLLNATGGSSSSLDLQVAEPASGRASCADLRLRATVTVDGSQEITFRWSSADGVTAGSARRDITGRQTVELAPRLVVPAGEDELDGRLTVTAELADGSSVSTPVDYRCVAEEDQR